jgi:hypothetical protein
LVVVLVVVHSTDTYQITDLPIVVVVVVVLVDIVMVEQDRVVRVRQGKGLTVEVEVPNITQVVEVEPVLLEQVQLQDLTEVLVDFQEY